MYHNRFHNGRQPGNLLQQVSVQALKKGTQMALEICSAGIIKRILIQALTLSITLFVAEKAFSMEEMKETSWHAVDNWRQPQGLPQNSVLSILRTRDGYLWVG